jgi:hypothetical protein
MAERLYKTVSIAHSGTQDYLLNEPSFAAFDLGPIPESVKGKSFVTVYRPASVIAAAKDLFTKQPFVLTHDAGMITPENYRENACGQTGDDAELRWTEDKEVTVVTSLTIMDQQAIDEYDSGVREVSPGYGGLFRWADGKTTDGIHYDIIMDKVTWVNHVALVDKGRGGKDSAILDHQKGAHNMKKGPKTGLIHRAIRKLGLITDSDPKNFRATIGKFIKDRAVMDEDAMAGGVEKIKAIIANLPESEEKAMLIRLIEDLPITKEQPDEVAQEVGNTVSDMYDNLDKKAMDEVKDAPGDPAADVPAQPAPTETVGGATPPAEPNAAGSPVVVPGGTGAAVIDIGAVKQKTADQWTPEEVHAIMNALVKLLPEEAQESEHADIAPDLEAGAAAGESVVAPEGEPAEPEAPESPEGVQDEDAEKGKEKEGEKMVGDARPFFASFVNKKAPDSKVSTFDSLLRGDHLKRKEK